MKTRWKRLFWALLAVAATAIGATAEAQNTVASISAKQLEAMMTAEDSRQMVVAVASWCGPCKKELPVLNRLYQKYQGKGLSMAAVSVDADGPQAMQPVVDRLGLSFPVYWTGPRALDKFKVIGVPTLFMIKGGSIVERVIGQRSEKFLEEKIKTLLKE